MKRIISLPIGMLGIFLFFASCGKDDSNDNPTINPDDPAQTEFVLNVEIDGVDHTFAEDVLVSAFSDQTAIYVISAFDENGHKIQMTMKGPAAVGALDLDDELSFIFADSDSWLATSLIDGSSAEITITENNSDLLEGTFLITAVNASGVKKEFVDGNFKARKL